MKDIIPFNVYSKSDFFITFKLLRHVTFLYIIILHLSLNLLQLQVALHLELFNNLHVFAGAYSQQDPFLHVSKRLTLGIDRGHKLIVVYLRLLYCYIAHIGLVFFLLLLGRGFRSRKQQVSYLVLLVDKKGLV